MATQHRPSDHRSGPRRAAAGGRKPEKSPNEGPNEGEGSRSAARDYNQRTERFIHEGRVDKSADEAKRAIDSPERDELVEAERIGRDPRRT